MPFIKQMKDPSQIDSGSFICFQVVPILPLIRGHPWLIPCYQ